MQPELPSTEEVQIAVQQAIEEAKRLPEMPAFVDYSELLADIQRWIAELESATADVGTAQQVGTWLPIATSWVMLHPLVAAGQPATAAAG